MFKDNHFKDNNLHRESITHFRDFFFMVCEDVVSDSEANHKVLLTCLQEGLQEACVSVRVGKSKPEG